MEIYREEFLGEFRFIEYQPFRLLKPSYALIALPDAGLVGVIAAGHMIRTLQLKELGGVDSYAYLPPVAIISKGNVRSPIRVFGSDNLLVIYSEFMPSPTAIVPLARTLINYVERKGADFIFLMTGIPVPNRFEIEKLRTYYIPSSKKAADLARNIDIQLFENGYLVGPYAVLLKETVRSKLDSLVLLTESFLEFPDPEASARNLEVFSKITGITLDLKDLLDQAEIIRIKARDTMKNVVRNLAQMRKDYEYTPPLNI
jgi:uncharacterized protein